MEKNQFFTEPRKQMSNSETIWWPSDTEENYKKISQFKKSIYGPNDFTYKFNNHGFRCDDFDNWKTYPHRILFAGCSLTEGIGSPIDKCWTTIMHKMICTDLGISMPFWSVGAGATGLDHMVRYIHLFKDLLKPQVIISFLPVAERRERWANDFWGAWEVQDKKDPLDELLLDDKFVSYQTEKNFILLNYIMQELDCLFLFKPYNPEFSIEHMNLSHVKQRNFNIDIEDYGRDRCHPGPITHKNLGEKMFEVFLSDIKEKLNL